MLSFAVKFDQICLASKNSVDKAVQFSMNFGLDPKKIVVDLDHSAKGHYQGKPAEWNLKLAYCYVNGMEVEFLQYVSGDSFHHQLEEGEISHLGTHVQSCKEFLELNPYMANMKLLEGELWKGERGWKYIYFDTK